MKLKEDERIRVVLLDTKFVHALHSVEAISL